MKSQASNTIAPGHEPIAGYVLEELIGRGGFGEVWRAEAPGGIKKAVKFVFGRHDDRRAEQEMKSLERIKDVQHPFILGLERFEIVNQQLVIVTELAESSLEDVFNKHRDRGSCGIPRNQLMTFMRDAADALDYLHQLYQLQHLDVKPANLLIVGGRVKVADFGLLKDLQDIECSAIGGLTPIYAPPEVFDGKPSMYSDQYSMAVMYQELLTGTRPFPGRTIAQLATQHVHNAPNLEPLPPSDRPILARALEKSPNRRFKSCSEFVGFLSDPRGSTKPGAGGHAVGSEDTTTQEGFSPAIGNAEVSDLPAIDANLAGSNTNMGHALVVGLGGLASECLEEICVRATQGEAEMPAFHCCFIDTDKQTAREMRRFQPSKYLPQVCSIATPLKTPQEYRDQGTKRLQTISRRWIYNVPRGCETEGMRPLGRLALLDHSENVIAKLREAIKTLKAACGNDPASVYVIASLSGGSSSGMYVDCVHILRKLLDEAGLEDSKVLSLLATSPLVIDTARPLAMHDTAAALTEIRHFLQPGNGYPGDHGANLPSLPAARTPLHDVYVVAETGIGGAPRPAKTITDYLWLDATVGKELLANVRKLHLTEESKSTSHASLRSVGMIRLGNTDGYTKAVLCPAATRKLLVQWLGNPSEANKTANSLLKRIANRSKLNQGAIYDTVISPFGQNRAERRALLMEHLRRLDPADLQKGLPIVDCLNRLVNAKVNEKTADSDIQASIKVIHREITTRLRDGDADIVSSIEAIRKLTRSIRQDEIQFRRELAALDPELNTKTMIANTTDKSTDTMRRLRTATDYGERMLHIHANRVATARCMLLCEQLAGVEARLSDAATVLAQCIQSLSKGKNGATPWENHPSAVQERVGKIIGKLHKSTASPWLTNLARESATNISVSALVSTINEIAFDMLTNTGSSDASPIASSRLSTNSITTSLSTSSQSHFVHNSRTVRSDTTQLTPSSDSSDGSITQLSTEESLEISRPPLLDCGGQRRLVLVAPNTEELAMYESELKEFHDGEFTSVVVKGSQAFLVQESQQIAIDDVLARLSALNGGNDKVTDRLLSRTDIQWYRPNGLR